MTTPREPRNPGPSWGPPILSVLDRALPTSLMRAALRFGTWFALPGMPAQRQASRSYLEAITGRSVTVGDIHRHFAALTESLWMKLRVGRGLPHEFAFAPNSPHADAFVALARSEEPALFGSLHVGQADLLGFFLHRFGRSVHMVRLRMGNSYDQAQLAKRFGDGVRFIWVNEPSELFFTLKQSLEAGATLALQCDRVEFGARSAGFRFLGARRQFPVTIYHLAWLYRRPVAFAFGFPETPDRSQVHVPPVLPAPTGTNKASYLAAAYDHFQAVLDLLESCLHAQPYQWFNFLPLNPVVSDDA